MASKIYPTLSTFYKAGNVGFGSEHDAMLGGVPEEKLYRKPSKQRGQISQADNVLEQPRTSTQSYGMIEAATAIGDTNVYQTSQGQLFEESGSPPLIPSAPPLLEMLDLRLQQYLNMLLASGPAGDSNASTTTPPGQDNQPANSTLPTDSDPHASKGPTATITLPSPPNVALEDSWLDEIRPDYDDLMPEQMADEILNNLNVERGGDTKDHEKQKSLSLLRNPIEPETDRVKENKERQRRQSYDHQILENRGDSCNSYQHHLSSQISRDDNAHIENGRHLRQHQEQKRQRGCHHQRQRNIPHRGATQETSRLQERGSRSSEDVRQFDRLKRPETVETYGVDTNRHAVYPHKNIRSHQLVSRGAKETDKSADARRERARSHRKSTNGAEKENQQRSPGRAEARTENSDYNAWMTWRKQVNRQLATIILLKQQGKEVTVQTTDMRRKSLRQSSIDFVSQIATQSGNTTSLGGKPYVMYGIPRASLLSKSESTADCRRAT